MATTRMAVRFMAKYQEFTLQSKNAYLWDSFGVDGGEDVLLFKNIKKNYFFYNYFFSFYFIRKMST